MKSCEKSIDEYAYDLQDALIFFVERADGDGCMSGNISTDGDMLLFDNEETWRKFVSVLDILGMSFTTGEPDELYTNEVWYIDFEYSDGTCF